MTKLTNKLGETDMNENTELTELNIYEFLQNWRDLTSKQKQARRDALDKYLKFLNLTYSKPTEHHTVIHSGATAINIWPTVLKVSINKEASVQGVDAICRTIAKALIAEDLASRRRDRHD
jgi:hypothetical protein